MVLKSFLFVALVLLAAPAQAHVSNMAPQTGLDGFIDGFLHPVLGMDHLLAMVCVGVVSALMGGRAVWLVPATFVCVMGVGGLFGLTSLGAFLVQYNVIEAGIALSVLALGVVIACNVALKTAYMMVAVGFFALFHGYAHGAEIPDPQQAGMFTLGFMAASAYLHVMGVFIGFIPGKWPQTRLAIRALGALVSLIGAYSLFRLIYVFLF